MVDLWEIENRFYERGAEIICGVDEAGRGPLAGRVYAAAVILPRDFTPDGLNDSKKLTAKMRDTLYDIIIENAKAYHIAYADETEVDRLNILNATLLAMRRAVEGLSLQPGLVLVDGNKAPDLEIPCETIVGGDGKSASIAAASILAKVTRDRYMLEMAELYPGYLFDVHKGYGTKRHYEMLGKYGPCPIHRQSFLTKYYGRS